MAAFNFSFPVRLPPTLQRTSYCCRRDGSVGDDGVCAMRRAIAVTTVTACSSTLRTLAFLLRQPRHMPCCISAYSGRRVCLHTCTAASRVFSLPFAAFVMPSTITALRCRGMLPLRDNSMDRVCVLKM